MNFLFFIFSFLEEEERGDEEEFLSVKCDIKIFCDQRVLVFFFFWGLDDPFRI